MDTDGLSGLSLDVSVQFLNWKYFTAIDKNADVFESLMKQLIKISMRT